MPSNNRIKIRREDKTCVVVFGYPNASGAIIARKAVEELTAFLEERYYITAHFIDKSDDGSKGIAVLIAPFDA